MSLDRSRLAKVLGLLDSDQEGERAAALGRATAMLRAAGMRWSQLLSAASAPAPVANPEWERRFHQESAKLRATQGELDRVRLHLRAARDSLQIQHRRSAISELRVTDLQREVEELRARLAAQQQAAVELLTAKDAALAAMKGDLPPSPPPEPPEEPPVAGVATYSVDMGFGQSRTVLVQDGEVWIDGVRMYSGRTIFPRSGR
jgi:hypothetical protein